MARDKRDPDRLAHELAALSRDERACVLAAAARERLRPAPNDVSPPLLTGGTGWTGGLLRREDVYDDDGR